MHLGVTEGPRVAILPEPHTAKALDHPCFPEGPSDTHKDVSPTRHTEELCANHLFRTSLCRKEQAGSPHFSRSVVNGTELAEAEKSPWSVPRRPVEGEKQVRIRTILLGSAAVGRGICPDVSVDSLGRWAV